MGKLLPKEAGRKTNLEEDFNQIFETLTDATLLVQLPMASGKTILRLSIDLEHAQQKAWVFLGDKN